MRAPDRAAAAGRRAGRAARAAGWAPPAVPRPGFAAPRIEADVGPWLPGAVVRLAPAAVVPVIAWLVDAGPVTRGVLAALAVVVVLRPGLPATAGLVLVAGLATVAGPDLLVPPGALGGASIGGPAEGPAGVPGALRLGVLVLCLDAVVRAGGLMRHVAWTARVGWSVAGRLGRSVLRTQLVVQPVLWLGYGLRGLGPGVAGAEALRLGALVSVAVLLALLVPRRAGGGGSGGL